MIGVEKAEGISEFSAQSMGYVEEYLNKEGDKGVVTSVIRHNVRSGSEADYERWLETITQVAKGYPGHSGVDFIRPPGGSGTYTILLRFDTAEHLRDWLGSDVRRKFLAEADQYFEQSESVDIRTGLEFWFTPPDPKQKHPVPYKQFLITLSVIFPLTQIVPVIVGPVFDAQPALDVPVLRGFVVAAIIVGLMTYVIMPRYTRLVAKWLYK